MHKEESRKRPTHTQTTMYCQTKIFHQTTPSIVSSSCSLNSFYWCHTHSDETNTITFIYTFSFSWPRRHINFFSLSTHDSINALHQAYTERWKKICVPRCVTLQHRRRYTIDTCTITLRHMHHPMKRN